MRIFSLPILLITLLSASIGYAAQAPTSTAPAQAKPAAPAASSSAPAASAAPSALPSSLLKSSMDSVQQTLGGLKLDKWKGGTVRTEASANIASIQQDLQSTLPSLLATADAAPTSVSKVLPASRNVDALYDVLLRVLVAARVSAPADQVAQLQQAASGFEKARHALDDHLQQASVAQEKQISDLQVSLKTQAQSAPVCPVVAPPPPATSTPAKKTTKKKPAAKPKPAPTTGTTTQPQN
jgi:hypothetical protein